MTSTQPQANQRADERYAMALPITMEGEEGATHDLSAGGILFESASEAEVGAQVALSLEYRRNGMEHRLACEGEVGAQVALSLEYRRNGMEHRLACEGEVVRVERHGDGYNIAVRLHAPLFAEAAPHGAT